MERVGWGVAVVLYRFSMCDGRLVLLPVAFCQP